MLANPEFLSSVLSTLPGVDPNDAQIQNVLASFTVRLAEACISADWNYVQEGEKKDGEKKDEKKEEDKDKK